MTTFDDSQCSWQQVKQDDCVNSITQTIQLTSTTSLTTSKPSTTSPSTISVTESVLDSHETDHSNSTVSMQNSLLCDPVELDSTWNCSNEFYQHSLCIKTDLYGHKEHKRCFCRKNVCSWKQKNNDLQVLENKPFQSNTMFSSLKGEKHYQFSDSLDSIIKQLQLVNKGEINVKFRLL